MRLDSKFQEKVGGNFPKYFKIKNPDTEIPGLVLISGLGVSLS